eukprot:5386482-Pyramimonas_sp.AAC.1
MCIRDSTCPHQGRLLPFAHAKATQVFEDMLATALNWTAVDYDDAPEIFLAQIQGAVGAATGLGKRKVAFLDKMPYLICQLGGPGVRDRCLQQYNEQTPSQRHDVSNDFFSESLSLRAD